MKKDLDIERVNEQLTIMTEKNPKSINLEKSYEATIVIKDLVRKGNQNNVKYCVKINIDALEHGMLKVPSMIKVTTWIINNRENKNYLKLEQVCDKIIISQNHLINNQIINADEYDTDSIIKLITDYLNSFEGIENDNNFQIALEKINNDLEENIQYLIDVWKKFDLDSYIDYQKYLLKIEEIEYLAKIKPIQERLDLLEQIKDERHK